MIGIEASELDTRWGGVPVIQFHGVLDHEAASIWPLTIKRRRRPGLFAHL
jgi:hypothetical protein